MLVLLVLSAAAVAFRVRPARRTALTGGFAALAVFLIHAFAEGMRWQMVPAYVLLGLMTLVLLWRSRRDTAGPGEKTKRGIIRKIFSGTVRFVVLPVVLAIAWFLPAAIPVFELPAPSGPLASGVSDLYLSFEDRPEILTADPSDHRELMVRVWYPAEVAPGSKPEPYFTRAEARAMADALGGASPVPFFFYSHVRLVKTNSHRDAEMAAVQQRFPVLVFSHGFMSYSSQNMPLMEELASHGYVVFSIAHTYDSSTVFPDERTPGLGEHNTTWMEEQMAKMEEDPEAFLEEFTRYIKKTDLETRRTLFEEQLQDAHRVKARGLGVGISWDVWIEDRTRFFDVLAELESGKRPSRFAGRLDLDQVGLFGMSFGGATAAEVCHVHPGCRAAINLDGGHMYGIGSTLYDGDISKPLMMLYSTENTTFSTPNDANPGDFQAHNDFYYEPVATEGIRNDVIRIRIDGTSHLHISDMSLITRFIPGMSSTTPGERIAEILNRYCLAFFDEYVKETGTRSPLLDRPSSEFPEVTFQTFGHAFDERRPRETSAE